VVGVTDAEGWLVDLLKIENLGEMMMLRSRGHKPGPGPGARRVDEI
jgi:hypothetical protein